MGSCGVRGVLGPGALGPDLAGDPKAPASPRLATASTNRAPHPPTHLGRRGRGSQTRLLLAASKPPTPPTESVAVFGSPPREASHRSPRAPRPVPSRGPRGFVVVGTRGPRRRGHGRRRPAVASLNVGPPRAGRPRGPRRNDREFAFICDPTAAATGSGPTSPNRSRPTPSLTA